MWEFRIRFKDAKKIEDCHPYIRLKRKHWIFFKGLFCSFLHNLWLKIKRSKESEVYWFDEIPFYWLITLPYGRYACPRIKDYIECINHEVMHGILQEIGGTDANKGWNAIQKNVAKWLPDVYGQCQCEHERD